MRTVYRAENLIDAHLVKDALENAEIPAFIAGEYLTGGVGQLPAMDYIAVRVPDSAAPAARSIVRGVEAQLAEARTAINEPAPAGPVAIDPGKGPLGNPC